VAEHGPSWLGIGAQRCGTTWFTDLLTQHPSVAVPKGVKEHDELYRYGLMRPWDEQVRDEYRKLFTHPKKRLGEFSPFYMRALWICRHTFEVLPEETPIVVMVRDPLDRFASGLRHMMNHAIRRHEKRLQQQEAALKPLPPKVMGKDVRKIKRNFLDRVAAAALPRYVLGPPDGKGMQDRTWMRYVGGDATYGGMYATQLEAWTQVFPKDRFVFIQYEKMKRDPQYYVDLVWKRMGLDPVPLKDIAKPSGSSTQGDLWSLEDHPHLVETLRAAYRPDAERLAEKWDVDLSLWKRLMGDPG
jgi:Sulfotransferase domain